MRSKSVLAAFLMASALIFHMIIAGEAVTTSSISQAQVSALGSASVLGTNSTSLIVLVFVNSSVYEGVAASLDQYRSDLVDFGFEDVVILNWSEPNPTRIRETLLQFYLNGNLAGALFVGDLPAVEYEMFTEWDYERFPSDLYYMDLDGNWTDSDNDGILDGHVGKKVAPEIWIGRIKTSDLGGDEISLINNYFDKNHRYRNGLLSTPRRALLYIDDDWANYEKMDAYSLGLLYNDITAVADKVTTNAADFKARLNEGYEFVHLRSHGSWNQHNFLVPGESADMIYSEEYSQIDPQALFYQLFVCSAARFTKPNYLAGEIVFNTNYGLLAIGSTKMGGMQMFWTLYEAIASGRTLGDAFKAWFIKWGEGRTSVSSHYLGRKWAYGLTIIGDPTLRLRWLGAQEIAELQKREEEVVDDLPMVIDLQQQLNGSQVRYSFLESDFNVLKGVHSNLLGNYNSLSEQLADIRNLLYFFLLVTTALAVANIYLIKTKPKSTLKI